MSEEGDGGGKEEQKRGRPPSSIDSTEAEGHENDDVAENAVIKDADIVEDDDALANENGEWSPPFAAGDDEDEEKREERSMSEEGDSVRKDDRRGGRTSRPKSIEADANGKDDATGNAGSEKKDIVVDDDVLAEKTGDRSYPLVVAVAAASADDKKVARKEGVISPAAAAGTDRSNEHENEEAVGKQTDSAAISSAAISETEENVEGEDAPASSAFVVMTVRTTSGQELVINVPEEVRTDEAAMMLVERSGVPGAYQRRASANLAVGGVDESSREEGGATHRVEDNSMDHNEPIRDISLEEGDHVVSLEEGDDMTPIIAHVEEERAPGEDGLSATALRIREQLIRNAPLVDSVVTIPDAPHQDEETAVNDEHSPGREGNKRPWLARVRPWRSRRRTWTALVLCSAVVVVLVLGLSIPLSMRGNDESESAPQGGQASPPSPSPSLPNRTTSDPSLAPTSVPSASPLEAPDTTQWKAIGSPITGLRNESGIIALIDYSTGGFSFGYSLKSNMTFSGLHLALSDDGKILVVGEPGTDTVRAFRWDADENDWVQKGQTLKGERNCPPDQIEEGIDDPTQFLPCHLSFGWRLAVSGDGSIVSVTAIGYRHQMGLVRSYKWDERLLSWVRLGSDLVGSERNQGFGTFLSLSQNGTTLSVSSPQSLNDAIAVQFGNVQTFRNGPGLVQTFDWNGTEWAQRGDPIFGSTNDEESLSFVAHVDLSMDGTSVAIGSVRGGYVEVYDWDASLHFWKRRGEPIVAPTGEDDFGSPVLFASLDQNRLVVGSNYDGDGNTEGAYFVYVYAWVGSGWVQLDRMNILQSSAQNRVGHNIKVTDDGRILAAAFASGVLIFEWNGSKYVPKGEHVGGGRSVALSNNGEVFAVGRPFDNSFGFGLGRTTVYKAA